MDRTYLKDLVIQFSDVKTRVWWTMADKWFRLLEFSLILGTLYYFKQTTGNIIVTVLYWVSFFFLFSWFLEVGEVFVRTSQKRIPWLPWIISMFLTLLVYTVITQGANFIIDQQMSNG